MMRYDETKLRVLRFFVLIGKHGLSLLWNTNTPVNNLYRVNSILYVDHLRGFNKNWRSQQDWIEKPTVSTRALLSPFLLGSGGVVPQKILKFQSLKMWFLASWGLNWVRELSLKFWFIGHTINPYKQWRNDDMYRSFSHDVMVAIFVYKTMNQRPC